MLTGKQGNCDHSCPFFVVHLTAKIQNLHILLIFPQNKVRRMGAKYMCSPSILRVTFNETSFIAITLAIPNNFCFVINLMPFFI
jgi:hypothetical protein